MNNYLGVFHMLLMLELLKLNFMNFRSKCDPNSQRWKNAISTSWQFLFHSYLIIFLYNDTKGMESEGQFHFAFILRPEG
jgi:hypothetical protein